MIELAFMVLVVTSLGILAVAVTVIAIALIRDGDGELE